MAVNPKDAAKLSDEVSVAPKPGPPPGHGVDPDSVIRAAKHQLAAADTTGDDKARADIEKASKARALVAERNDAKPDRVKAIDGELKALGFELPLPTPTSAQRAEPVGRRTPGTDKA